MCFARARRGIRVNQLSLIFCKSSHSPHREGREVLIPLIRLHVRPLLAGGRVVQLSTLQASGKDCKAFKIGVLGMHRAKKNGIKP